MFSKFVVFIFLLASTLAIDLQEANSYVSYNDNNNLVEHIQSTPVLVKVAAPAPVYESRAAPIYATPLVPKVAFRTVAKYAAPSAYFSNLANPVYSSPTLVNYATPSTYIKTADSSIYAPSPVTNIATVAYPAPVPNYAAASSSSDQHQEEYAHPKYEYAYSIEDHHTGDLHSQQEQRDGDHVVGQYSLREADGTLRIVRYYDNGHGFNAVVEKHGTATEAPVVLKKVVVPVTSSHY